MTKCNYCEKEILLPFKCKFCGGYFCEEHRLPEKHNCPNIPKPLPLGPASHPAKNPYALTKPRKKEEKKKKEIIISEGPYLFVKETRSEKSDRKTKHSIKIAMVLVALVILGVSLCYFLIPYSQKSSNESYIELTLRDLPATEAKETVIEFGDTEYSFQYSGGNLWVRIPFQSKYYIPREGEIYHDFGIEIKVSKISSDYISDYIVILVRPTVQNYMFTQFRYTKVNITLHETKAVNISSGLINKTNQYWFTYTQDVHPTFSEPQLIVQTTSQSKTYYVWYGTTIREFEIEIRVYKITPEFMIIYVKPLY